MTKTEELLKLAEAATPGPWKYYDWASQVCCVVTEDGESVTSTRFSGLDDHKFIAAANPATIKALVELVRLQHELILEYSGYNTREELRRKSVVEAYERFEKGEG